MAGQTGRMHLRRASAARPSLAICYRASEMRVCRPPRRPGRVHWVPRHHHTGRTASLPHYDACHPLPGLFTRHCCGITSPRSPRGPCALSIPLSLGPEVSSASSSSTCRQSNFVSSSTKVSVSSVDKQTYWDTPLTAFLEGQNDLSITVNSRTPEYGPRRCEPGQRHR